MNQNTIRKSLISNGFAKLCEKHTGLNPLDPNNQKKFDQMRHERDAKTIRKANKELLVGRISNAFLNDSIFEDDSLKKARFDNYDTSFSKEAESNYHKSVQIMNQYITGHKFNTVFLGPCGRGKSHLALSILIGVLHGRNPLNSGLFMDVNKMMQKIKDSFDSHEPIKARVEKQLSNAYLVVLDDLGAEHISDFDREVLFNVFNSQHRIIVTTNLMPDEIRKNYGDRIYSRLRQGTTGHIIQFTDKTKDYRISGGNK